MNNRRSFVLIFCIVILGSFLRLYKLDQIPPGVNRDEASIGYTAYSILQTGKDEYGRSLPLSFESFGDWKLPLYIYLTIPFVKFLGMNELAVRLPSALAGVLTILLTYVLVKELFKNNEKKFFFGIGRWTLDIATMSSLLLALSPWHVHLSRTESESNVAVFFTVLGLLLFFKGLKNRFFLLPPAGIFLALPFYTYHGNHVTSTLLIGGLLFMYRKQIPKNIFGLLSLIILITLPAFIFSQTLGTADRTKLSGISIFGDPSVIHEKIETPRNRYANPNGWVPKLLYNRVTYGISAISINYINAFLPEFLFIRGGTNNAHNIQGMGNLYIADALFFYLGIGLLFYYRKKQPFSLLLWWLLISPVAASITKDAPHTNRIFAIYPIPPVLVSLGIFWILTKWKTNKFLLPITGFITVLYLCNVAYYLNTYFISFPRYEASHWGYPYKELDQKLSETGLNAKKVIMTHPEYSPYIYLLFYSGYDPLLYQKTAKRYPPTTDAFVHVASYDRFEFRPIDWKKDMYQPDTILIGYTGEVPTNIPAYHTKSEIFLPDGTSFLTIVTN